MSEVGLKGTTKEAPMSLNDIVTYFRTNDTICVEDVAKMIVSNLAGDDYLIQQYIQERSWDLWDEIEDAAAVLMEKEVYMDTLDIPNWIDARYIPDSYDEFISWCQDIKRGGCASGVYMPAVEYATAKKTMAEYGEEITEFIEDHGYASGMQEAGMTVLWESGWAAFNVWVVSLAVEAWANIEGNGII